MAVEVVPYSAAWPRQFDQIAERLGVAMADVPNVRIEHVGSTAVPGLAAKPIIDIDVVVGPEQVGRAISALQAVGYLHLGDLGLAGREAFSAPDDVPRRHVYVCRAGSLSLRNHVAVREVLRARPDLRDRYAAVKLALAADPAMDIETYIARKSAVLQQVLAVSDLTEAERLQIWQLNVHSTGRD